MPAVSRDGAQYLPTAKSPATSDAFHTGGVDGRASPTARRVYFRTIGNVFTRVRV